MKLIIGLGNPGIKYANTRHNIGFMAIDAIAAHHQASPFRAKFQSLLSEAIINGSKCQLLKPQTFMNLSGEAVIKAAQFYKLSPQDVIVLHDELDLAPGKIRLKNGGGHAGHNGLRSITAHIGSDFWRIRLGIGHPGRKEEVSHYVLSDFSRSDSDWLAPLLEAIGAASAHLASGQFEKFMTGVALKQAPTKTKTPPPLPTPPKDVSPEAPASSPFERLRQHFSRK